jgi:hypothetical protein
MKLAPGLYEQLITRQLEALVRAPGWVPDVQGLSPDAAADLLARHIHAASCRRQQTKGTFAGTSSEGGTDDTDS